MWKQSLETKGISTDALPKKIKSLIADYNDIEAGIVELKQELANVTDEAEKQEINGDVAELEQTLNALNNEIYKSVALLKSNPDGSVGTYTADELMDAWNARRTAWVNSDKKSKTKSIF